MKKKNKFSKEELFKTLIWIPEVLSYKVYNLEKIGFQRKDLEQELKIVLWTSMEHYLKMLKEGKKPKIDIKRYCYTSVSNSKIDFIRKLNCIKRETVFLSIEKERRDLYKVGEQNVVIKIPKDSLSIIIDEFNILDVDVPSLYKLFFKDFLLGYTYKEIANLYDLSINVVRNNIFQIRKKIRVKFSLELKNYFQEKTFYKFGRREELEIFNIKKEGYIFQETKTTKAIKEVKNKKLFKYSKLLIKK